MIKRILALALALLLVVNIMPMSAFAVSGNDMPDTAVESEIETAAEEAESTEEKSLCPTCGQYDCVSDHLTWCSECKKDDCGKTHVWCETCQKNDCGVEHKTCEICNTVDCTAEHKVCGTCNTMDCKSSHETWCTICLKDDCGTEHKACDTCGNLDCTKEHKVCDKCEKVDCTADHTNWCKECKKDDCGVEHKKEILRVPVKSAGLTTASSGKELTQDFSGDIGKYVRLSDAVSSIQVYEKETTIQSAFFQDSFTEDTILKIVDWEVNGKGLWYLVEFYSGEVTGDLAGGWPANPWILQTDGNSSDALVFIDCCETCGKPDCDSSHENWCEICEKDNCGLICEECKEHGCEIDHDAQKPTEPELHDPDSGVTVYFETIPENMSLKVKEADLGEKIGDFLIPVEKQVFALDISLQDENGTCQPESTVGVKIPVSAPVGSKIGILHKHGDTTEYVGWVEVLSDNTVEFATDKFSEFVGFTVDFHYNGIDFSIDGESSILLSELFEALEITDRPATDAESVVFSDPYLLTVDRLDDGDWVLTSTVAFDTEETLVITFSDDSVMVIDVTDEQGKVEVGDYNRYGLFQTKITANGDSVVASDGNHYFWLYYSSKWNAIYRHITFHYNNGSDQTDKAEHYPYSDSTSTRFGSNANNRWFEIYDFENVNISAETNDSFRETAYQISAKTGISIGNSDRHIYFYVHDATISIPKAEEKLCTVSVKPRVCNTAANINNKEPRDIKIYLNGELIGEKYDVYFPNDDSYDDAGGLTVTQNNKSRYKLEQTYDDTNNVYILNFYDYAYKLIYNTNGGKTANFNTSYSARAKESMTFTISDKVPEREGYDFLGWSKSKTATEAEYVAGDSYKITGQKQTKSPYTTITATETLYAVWSPKTDTVYKVKIYHENADDADYTNVSTEDKTGTTDKEVSVTPPAAPTGFEYNSSKSVVKGTVTGDGELVLEIYYDRIESKLTLEKGTGISSVTGAETYKYGASVTINASCATGYEWSKWTNGSSQVSTNQKYTFTMPASATTYKANAKPVQCDVEFDINYEGGTDPAKGVVEYSGKYSNLPIVQRVGYSFDGWYTAASGGSKVTADTVCKQTTEHTLYAHWTENVYNITYDLDEGELPEGITNYESYRASSADFTLNNPEKTGYTFTGWTEEISTSNWTDGFVNLESGNYEFNNTYPSSVFSEKIYVEKGVTYTINGSGLENIRWRLFKTDGTYVASISSSKTCTPSENGYVHVLLHMGCTEANRNAARITSSQGDSVTIVSGSTGDRKYIANWDANEYTVAFDGNGATGGSMESQSFKYGENAKELTANAFKKEYTVTYHNESTTSTAVAEAKFNGWATSADGDKVYDDKQSVSNLTSVKDETITLYADWEAAEVTLPELEERIGYSFKGWYADSEFNTFVGNAGTKLSITENTDLYAKWERGFVTLTVIYDDKQAEPQNNSLQDYTQTNTGWERNVDTGATISLPEITAKTGYKIIGMLIDDVEQQNSVTSLKMEQDTVVEILSSPIEYTICFNKNADDAEGSMADQTMTYDKKEKLTENTFTRAGYTFIGWAETADGAVEFKDKDDVINLSAQDGAEVTLYAVWEVKTFKLEIETQNNIDNDQTYLFTVEGEGLNGQEIKIVIALGAKDKKSISGLPAGTYTISDQQKWSWRYSPQSKTVSFTDSAPEKQVFTYNSMIPDKVYWLNGYSSVN